MFSGTSRISFDNLVRIEKNCLIQSSSKGRDFLLNCCRAFEIFWFKSFYTSFYFKIKKNWCFYLFILDVSRYWKHLTSEKSEYFLKKEKKFRNKEQRKRRKFGFCFMSMLTIEIVVHAILDLHNNNRILSFGNKCYRSLHG